MGSLSSLQHNIRPAVANLLGRLLIDMFGDDGTHTTAPAGVVLTMAGTTVYHTGDTALTMEMKLLESRVDVMLVPIGDNYTMGVEDAARAVEFVRPQIVIPMHYNTWDVIKADPDAFKRKVGNQSDVVILAPGQSIQRT